MFPNVLELLVQYLSPIVAPAPVLTVVPDQPKPRPERFVQLARVGGTTATVRDIARVDAWAWSGRAIDAWELALATRQAVWQLAGTDLLGPMVYRVSEIMAPTSYDDPVSHTPRVWTTYELSIRADSAIHHH